MSDEELPNSAVIEHREGGSTETVGHLPDDRQFLGLLVQCDEGWLPAVLFFSAEGDLTETEHESPVPANGDTPPSEAVEQFDKLIRRLEPYRKDAIKISRFETEVCHQRIALVPGGAPGTLELQPIGLVLSPPGEVDDTN